MSDTAGDVAPSQVNSKLLFATCMVALIATSFAFIIRIFILDDVQAEFELSQTQKGELFGAGLWPFAISIVVFSLFIDRVGYGRSLWFAFVCHAVSVPVTIFANSYEMLYIGNVLAALAAGTVEAVINPVIATVYWRHKTKWLNILHAGWPGGLVLGGLLSLSLGATGVVGGMFDEPVGWRWKVGLLLIPVVLYGLLLVRTKFPVNERVTGGVPYRTMLAEMGAMGIFIAASMVMVELFRVTGVKPVKVPNVINPESGWALVSAGWFTAAAIAAGFYVYARSLGRPLFIFLLLIMILLAITELGTDTWIKDLMGPVMEEDFKINGGWVLVYTASIMIVLRLSAGPFVKVLNPLGLLSVSCLFAAAGLALLSGVRGWTIILAATVYGIGQTFFWPTMLGVVAERFPKGGALTLNAIAGVGMLGVGIIGAPLLGSIQDTHIQHRIEATDAELAGQVLGEPAIGIRGEYRGIDEKLVEKLPEASQAAVQAVQNEARQEALLQVAVLPLIMFVCYVGLLLYFRSKGGYKEEVLAYHTAEVDGDAPDGDATSRGAS